MEVECKLWKRQYVGKLFRPKNILSISLSALLSVSMANAEDLVLEPRVWTQASLPANAGGVPLNELFTDDLLAENYGSIWRVFIYDAIMGEYKDPGINGTIAQGQGFWIIQISENTVQITLGIEDVQDASVLSTTACFNAESGCAHTILDVTDREVSWNMVGSPFDDGLPASQLRIVSGADDTACSAGCSLADATAAGLTDGELFHYPGQDLPYEDVASGGSLQPWDGYWLGLLPAAIAQAPITLLIPRRDLGDAPLPPGELPPQPVETGTTTLVGVDSDNDGLRDDAQIALHAMDYDEPEMAAARQSLISLQNAMLVGGGVSDESIQAAGNRLTRAMECLLDTFGERAGDELSFHEFIVNNTDERRSAAQAFDGQSVGRQFSSVTNGDACE